MASTSAIFPTSASSPAGHRDHEVEHLVLRRMRGMPVDVEEHVGGEPCETLVAIDEGVVAGERVQQRGGLEVERGVGIRPEGGGLRPGGGGGEQAVVAHQDLIAHGIPGDDQKVLEVEVLDHASPSRRSASAYRSAPARDDATTRAR